jgi:hypothetical protein
LGLDGEDSADDQEEDEAGCDGDDEVFGFQARVLSELRGIVAMPGRWNNVGSRLRLFNGCKIFISLDLKRSQVLRGGKAEEPLRR